MKCDVHGVENCNSPSCAIWNKASCQSNEDKLCGLKDTMLPGIQNRHIASGITGDAGYCCKCGEEIKTNHPPKDSTGKPVVEDGNY